MTSVKVVKYRGSTLRGTFEGHKGSDYGKIEDIGKGYFFSKECQRAPKKKKKMGKIKAWCTCHRDFLL